MSNTSEKMNLLGEDRYELEAVISAADRYPKSDVKTKVSQVASSAFFTLDS